MILLEEHNVIIKDILTERFQRPATTDQAFVDFDGVRFHLSTPNKKTQLLLSMDWRCYNELTRYGASELIQREYGPYITETEPDYSVSLAIDLEQLPADLDERAQLIRSMSLLKRNTLAAPFERAFALQKQLDQNPEGQKELMAIHYRPDEAIYICPGQDRVTVVFSTVFKEETDRIFGKVFLQEFVDARRQPAIQGAPQVLYSNREPPLEIRGVPGLSTTEDVGYVTFVLFPRHFRDADSTWKTISQIQMFRDYLHYHIKCSKAYMHSRMRARVAEFLKVLNRAKPEVAEKEKKTASYVSCHAIVT
ncbi:hypothetical protein E5Q_00304 [Mixia osmundae IAM 14324]|uniref:Arp2/3 complex 34 kDa subunit n=1 Tax=Mixia osmundae (strain CBS 9802 / IAM 14324 / JCM 22182 / KY 12970) TaxID=764103 RepID=G7DSU7_MIXOS|nr:hypothetical protein E5Q_00304 [Mixia osmundae IAM 14324]